MNRRHSIQRLLLIHKLKHRKHSQQQLAEGRGGKPAALQDKGAQEGLDSNSEQEGVIDAMVDN